MDRNDGLVFNKKSEKSPQRFAKFAREFDQSLGIGPAGSSPPKNLDIVNVISGSEKKTLKFGGKGFGSAVPQS